MISSLVQKILSPFDLVLRRRSTLEQSGSQRFLKSWRELAPTPTFIIDVGANIGNWTRNALQIFPDTDYLMIEPQDELKARSADLLSRKNVKWLAGGAGDASGVLQFLAVEKSNSSTFLEDAVSVQKIRREVPVYTLSEIAKSEGRIPEIVKIDAEGFDLRVLHGATDLLGKTDVFFTECAVSCRTIPNSLAAVIARMSEHGYLPVDITDLEYSAKSGLTWVCELAFLRAQSPVWQKLANF